MLFSELNDNYVSSFALCLLFVAVFAISLILHDVCCMNVSLGPIMQLPKGDVFILQERCLSFVKGKKKEGKSLE